MNERESGFQPYTAYSQSVLAAAAIASLTTARTVLLREALPCDYKRFCLASEAAIACAAAAVQ